MHRSRAFAAGRVGACGLLLAFSTALGAEVASRPTELTQHTGFVSYDPSSERGLLTSGDAPRGIRSFGKRAVRLDTSRSVVREAGTGREQSVTPSYRSIGANVRISGLPMAGSVISFALSPNGAIAVYVADQETAGRPELFSAPVDGSAVPTKISAGLSFGAGDDGVGAFQITPDGTQVVFLADPNLGAGTNDVFSVPIDGSTSPVRLNAAAQAPVTAFGLTADSARVAFFGVDSSFGSGGTELYAATIGAASSAIQLSDAGSTNAQGNVTFADTSPDGGSVVYLADSVADGVFQWHGVSITAAGPGSDAQLSASLGSAGLSSIGPDGGTVVYTGDDNILGVLEVFAVPIGGGPRIQLNPSMAGAGATAIAISPDGGRVGYLADQDSSGVTEVYGAVIGTAGSGIRLNTPLSGTQFADTLNISPDGTTVLYEADEASAGTFELYGVPIDASSNPTTLHGLAPPDNAGFFERLGTPIVGRRAVYPVLGAAVDLFSVPFDGSEPFVRINDPLASEESVFNAFVPASASRLTAYGVGLSAVGVTKRIHVVPIRRDLEPEQVNVTATSGADGVLGYEIASDENYAVYLQDQDTAGKPELYSRELDSDGDGVVNRTDSCSFVANPAQDPVVLGQTVFAASKASFTWSEAAEVRFARGPLSLVDVLATNDSGSLSDAVSYEDPALPVADSGIYYLFAHDCAGRSYQTSPGAEPGRDQAALP